MACFGSYSAESSTLSKDDIITVVCEGLPIGVVILKDWKTSRACDLREAAIEQIVTLDTAFQFLFNENIPVGEQQESMLPLTNLVRFEDENSKVTVRRHYQSRPARASPFFWSVVCLLYMIVFIVFAVLIFATITVDAPSTRALVIEGVIYSVQMYFVTFQNCWMATGHWLVTMISEYLQFLAYMCSLMLSWPVVIVLAICANVSLFIVYKLITAFVPHRHAESPMNGIFAV